MEDERKKNEDERMHLGLELRGEEVLGGQSKQKTERVCAHVTCARSCVLSVAQTSELSLH